MGLPKRATWRWAWLHRRRALNRCRRESLDLTCCLCYWYLHVDFVIRGHYGHAKPTKTTEQLASSRPLHGPRRALCRFPFVRDRDFPLTFAFLFLFLFLVVFLHIHRLSPGVLPSFPPHLLPPSTIARMKASHLLVQCASIASAAAVANVEPHQTNAAPGAVTATPTLNSAARRWKPDPSECETENLTPLFNPPTPTGDLDKALNSYLISAGSSHCSQTLIGVTLCEVLSPSAWCHFTSEAPTSVLEAYTTHASKLSVWSSKYSSGLAALPTKCPCLGITGISSFRKGRGWRFSKRVLR